MTKIMTKRTYTRRTEDDRIRELEAKLEEVKARLEERKRMDTPLLREWMKARKVLRAFQQTATDSGRSDLALSAEAFAAGLERSIHTNPEEQTRRRSKPAKNDSDPWNERP
jgi:hypothetical protein